MILDDAIEDEDIELAYESFFQIERRIKEESLFKKFQITFDENIKYVLENPYEKSSNSFLEIKNFELK